MLFTTALPSVAIEYEMIMSQASDSSKFDEEDSDPYHRTLPQNVLCVIAEDGIRLPILDGEEMTLFEIIDTNGVMQASFTAEEDFLEFVFTTHVRGIVEIRIYTDRRYFRGYLDLEY